MAGESVAGAGGKSLERVLEVALVLAALALLYLSSLSSYLLFHSLAEAAFIAVGVAIFVMAWHLRRFSDDGFATVIGTGLVFVSALQLLHALAYKGMGVFPEAGADLPTQLWIACRYLTAATFVAAPFFLRRRPSTGLLLGVYAAVTAALLAAIFWWKVFPVCYLEGVGLTAFKKDSEYVIAALFVAAAGLVIWRGRDLGAAPRRILAAAMLVSAAAEILFTLYIGVYTWPNLVGHLLMFVSVYLLYRGVVLSGMARTYASLVDELAALSHQLERRVDERTAELTKVVAELETVSYSVSHELRSPLRAIDGFCYLALEDGRDVLDARTLDGLERARAAAQHMGHLIDDLLDVMKVGRSQPEPEAVDLSALADSVALTLAEDEPGRDVRISVESGLVAHADLTLTRVALHNLLGNAWKFTRREHPAEIAVGAEDRGGRRVFFVRDNGIGIDEQLADDVFEPFHRHVRAEEFEGTGVGLALVQRIVRLHGGDAWITGVPGEGATVYFTLAPAAGSTDAEEGPLKPPPAPA
jgi:signal transduction histidine kinase